MNMNARESSARQTPMIHIVDDDESFQSAISRVLRAAGYEVCKHTNVGNFLLSYLDDRPGCILLDLNLRGFSGLDIQQALAARSTPLPIIFLTGYGDIPSSVRAIKAGAVDFLTKPVKREVLLRAIRNALAQGAQSSLAREKLKQWLACYSTLTAREIEVFERVVAGRMNKEIAAELGAAERTIKLRRSRVMEKMRAGSLAELVHISGQLKSGLAGSTMSSSNARPELPAMNSL